MGVVASWFTTRDLVCAGITRALVLSSLCWMAAGCQSGKPTVSNTALLAHLPGVNFSGLTPMRQVAGVNVACSVPEQWKPLKLEHTALYSHQQWKSPSGYTGVGVVYAGLPIPLDAQAVLWFAKLEYGKRGDNNNQIIAEWTDNLGRPWFEAQNSKYHVRGYAMTDGGDAWIVYFGYKVNRPPDPSEVSLAARCVDTVVPGANALKTPLKPKVAQANPPAAGKKS